MPTKEEVGRRLRMSRFKRDMTLKEVAARSGMSATHISEIERGKTSPTIGALQRIATALGERPAHFVEERDASLAVLTRRDQRATVYICDTEGTAVHQMERLNADPPWATLRLFRTMNEPGEKVTRPPRLGEVVILNVKGAAKITVGNESYVLRAGDTIQFPPTGGYTVEVVGDEPSELVGVGAFAPSLGW